MIIVKLIGGLGNQMFQYALGRSIANKNQETLKLDISGYKDLVGLTKRKYILNKFNVKEKFSSEKENKKIKSYEAIPIIKKILNKLPFFFNSHFIFQRNMKFNFKILKLNKSIYLDGYWQTEKYFFDIADIIRSEFTLKSEYNHLDQDLLNKINKCNSVSLHIRRGDYVNNKVINRFHGLCSLDYYKKSIDIISKKISRPVFFCFSNDINWCKNNLKIKYPLYFVENNKNYEDLVLMSCCKHNIIANSSFSWWGAWLNNNPNKIVIAPRKWFADKKANSHQDIIPLDWIKL